MTVLQDTAAEIIQKWMVDQGLAAEPQDENTVWPVYVNWMPDGPNEPDDTLCVYDTDPREDGRLMATGERIEHPGLQFRVRAQNGQSGYEKLKSIVDAVDTLKQVSVILGTRTYKIRSVTRIGGIIRLGLDERRREGFTANAICTIADVT